MGMILDLEGPVGAESRRGSFYLYGPGIHPHETYEGGMHVEIEVEHLADYEEALAAVRKYLESRGETIPPSSAKQREAVRMDWSVLEGWPEDHPVGRPVI